MGESKLLGEIAMTVEFRTCYKCWETKSTTNYYKDKSRKSGLANKCKSCSYTVGKSRYCSNLAIVKKLKSVPCSDCGISYPHYVMDFDHLPSKNRKRWSVNRRVIGSITTLMEEIDKCEIVCSNCHRIRTWKRRKGEM